MFDEFRKQVEGLVGEYKRMLELPNVKENEIGDLALPCFYLSKLQHRPPQEIAQEIAAGITKLPPLVKEVKAVGSYVNFYINHEKFAPMLIKEIRGKAARYGSSELGKESIVAVESPGPNTNKPLHLGHIRNMLLGSSVANILEFTGYDVVRVDIVNDRGVHICKSMLAYKDFGSGAPDKKSDHFVGDFYVRFASELEGKPGTEERLRKMLVDWEEGDKDVRALWKKMNGWAVDGIKQTYKRFGMKIDKAYYESEHYNDGKKIVTKGLKDDVFKKDEEGNIIIDLEDLGKRTLLRADGTSVYITQDLALAEKRFHELHMKKMIYVVAEEQADHFRALFRIMEILKYPFAENCYHLSYGMVNLPEGKMKSREGTVVDADNLMDEMRDMAAEKIRQRGGMKEEHISDTAEKIGLASIKYFIAKFDPVKAITYDPKASLEFEGDTGPYVLYTYARANSIMKKATASPAAGVLHEKLENDIVMKLSLFPSAVERAANELRPSIIANYVFELASMFNEYYHSVKVVETEHEPNRLAMVAAVMQVLENSLRLLGIDTVKEM